MKKKWGKIGAPKSAKRKAWLKSIKKKKGKWGRNVRGNTSWRKK